MTALRIATWNVEYADSAATNIRRKALMDQHPADIWVLTETHDALAPSGAFTVAHSAARPPYGKRVKTGSRWVSIWSRYPMEPLMIEGGDDERTVATRVQSALGPVVVYGTVMPWCGDKGRMGERADASGWSEFYRVVPNQIEQWRKLIAENPDAALCVAGDYNVDLATGSYYGSREAISIVQKGMNACDMFCATAPERLPLSILTHPPIDHIALPNRWADCTRVVGAWEGRIGQPRLSDHSGLVVEIKPV